MNKTPEVIERQIRRIVEKIPWIPKIVAQIVDQNYQNEKQIKANLEEELHIRTKSENALIRIAYYSQLTGLLNRVGIAAKISQNFDENSMNTAVVFDVDYLKKYNTAHEHDGGDLAIIHVWMIAWRVVKQFKLENPSISMDFAHLSGDEFVIVIAWWVEYAQEVARRIHHELKLNQVSIGEESYNVSVTCWIASTEHVEKYETTVKQKGLGIEIPLWFAKVMKLADMAVSVAERWNSHVYDGTIIEKDLDKETEKWIESLSDMLRWIHTQKVLKTVLQEMVVKIASKQDREEHVVAIDGILQIMKSNKEITEKEARYIDSMLDHTNSYRDFINNIDPDHIADMIK